MIIIGHNEIFSHITKGWKKPYVKHRQWFFWAKNDDFYQYHDQFHEGKVVMIDGKFLVTEGLNFDTPLPFKEYYLQSRSRLDICPLISFTLLPIFFPSLIWEIIKLEVDEQEMKVPL